MSEALFIKVQRYLNRHYPGSMLSSFALLSGGWECDIYTFTFTFGDGRSRDLVLRLFLGNDDDNAAKTRRESAGLVQLYRAGYPVPEMLLAETDTRVLGKAFIIMEKVNGQGLWGAMASAEPLREDLLLDQFGRLVARLHQLDWKPFTEHTTRYQVDPAAVLEDWFAPLRRSYREYHVEGFLNVIDWLDAHKSDITVQPAVVHLDFHANNVLIDPTDNDRMTVIDWSQLTVSDYRSDLAWTLMIMGDHGKPGWREKLLIAYSAASGHTIPNLEYFDVMCYLKLLASTVVSIKVGMEKLGMRPENEDTRKEQAIYLRQFADRLHNVTGLTIPEVEAALKQLTQA